MPQSSRCTSSAESFGHFFVDWQIIFIYFDFDVNIVILYADIGRCIAPIVIIIITCAITKTRCLYTRVST